MTPFEPLFEIAAKFRACQKRSQVKGVNLHILQDVGNAAIMYFLHQSFGQGGFTHPRVPHQNRVVFPSAAEHLHGAFDFKLSADEGVELAHGRTFNQIDGVLFQGVCFFLFARPGSFRSTFVIHSPPTGAGRLWEI